MSDYKLGIENDKLRALLNDYENELSRTKRESMEKIQMNNKETFEEWLSDQKLPSHNDYYLRPDDLEFVWDYQQTKYEAIIAKKDEEIERLSNAISDYCDCVKPKQVSEIEKGGK